MVKSDVVKSGVGGGVATAGPEPGRRPGPLIRFGIRVRTTAVLTTTWNQALDRLDVASRTDRQFVADAAHELRSPIGALMTVIEVAQAYPTSEHRAEALDSAHAIGHRLQVLVDDLLLLARMDAGEGVLSEPLDLRDVAGEALRPGVTLQDGPPVVVRADRRLLQRAVDNLVDNAVRHAGSGVEIACTADGRLATLAVSNDGEPIPPPDLERVFDRFVRLDEGRDRDSGGCGLGLAIVRDVAERHGGTARALERGNGATFALTLPVGGPPGGGPDSRDRERAATRRG